MMAKLQGQDWKKIAKNSKKCWSTNYCKKDWIKTKNFSKSTDNSSRIKTRKIYYSKRSKYDRKKAL